MYQTIPDEWKSINVNKPKRKQPNKRKKPMPGGVTTSVDGSGNEVVTSTNTTLENIEIPGEKKLKTAAAASASDPLTAAVQPGNTPVYSVIQTANPISALYEYCKKGTK